jgi:hypothetical protein
MRMPTRSSTRSRPFAFSRLRTSCSSPAVLALSLIEQNDKKAQIGQRLSLHQRPSYTGHCPARDIQLAKRKRGCSEHMFTSMGTYLRYLGRLQLWAPPQCSLVLPPICEVSFEGLGPEAILHRSHQIPAFLTQAEQIVACPRRRQRHRSNDLFRDEPSKSFSTVPKRKYIEMNASETTRISAPFGKQWYLSGQNVSSWETITR